MALHLAPQAENRHSHAIRRAEVVVALSSVCRICEPKQVPAVPAPFLVYTTLYTLDLPLQDSKPGCEHYFPSLITTAISSHSIVHTTSAQLFIHTASSDMNSFVKRVLYLPVDLLTGCTGFFAFLKRRRWDTHWAGIRTGLGQPDIHDGMASGIWTRNGTERWSRVGVV